MAGMSRPMTGGPQSEQERPPGSNRVAEETVDIRTLVVRHHEELYRYALRLSGSVPDAEDLTQHALLTAQAKLHQLRSAETARPWLFAILRNAYLKTRRAPRELPEASLEVDMENIPGQTVESDPFDRELLQAAINELPAEFKVVLLMFYFEEYSYRQIAEELELPPGTVMSRLSRAKQHLRARMLEPEQTRVSGS